MWFVSFESTLYTFSDLKSRVKEVMLLVVLSHPHNGWSMVKFSTMLKKFINPGLHHVNFISPTNWFSEKIPNLKIRKIVNYCEKKVLFPLILPFYAKKVGARYLLLCDHSDAQLTLLVQNCVRIVICHDLFAIQAMLGEIPNIKQSFREKAELRVNYSMLKKSNLIIAVSESTAQNIEQYLPAIPVEVLPLTVTKVSGEISHEDLEDIRLFGQFCILPMNSHWRKNRIEGIQAWSELRLVSPEKNLRLVIIGNQLDKQELHFLNENGGLAHVHIRSNVSEEFLASLYQKCEFVIFTSRYEGFGLPIIESNCYGKLVLHSDLEVLNKIAGPYNIKLQNSFQDNEWRNILENLLSKDRRLQALNYYKDNYSNKRFEDKLEKILSDVMIKANK